MGQCTVFDSGRGKLVVGAIIHEKGEGGCSLIGGQYLVAIALHALQSKTRGNTYTTDNYENIPPGVVITAQMIV